MPSTHVAFAGHRLVAAGNLQQVALVACRALARDAAASVLVFENATGRQVDLDLGGGEQAVAARYTPAPTADEQPAARGRGRPKLGVVAREVTLLPEHWDWLAAQPGGASVALRKLVLHAMRTSAPQDAARRTRERAYAFMAAIAGDLPGFEEASRALFAGEDERLATLTRAWPADVRQHLLRLLQAAPEPAA